MGTVRERKTLRLKGFDYSSSGAYFVTVCVKNKQMILGNVVGDDAHVVPPAVILSEYGKIVNKYIENVKSVYENALIDKYVIMPNHIHMIIILQNTALKTKQRDVGIAPYAVSVPSIIRSIKTLVTKEIGFSIWQTSYHDHIIRGDEEYNRIWEYIDENPIKWAEDEYYNES